MKVVILGKGEMLCNLIEGTLDAKCDIVGVFRYERTAYSALKLALHNFFKSSSDYTLIKQHKLHEIKCKSANSEEFKKEIIKLNADVILVGTWCEKLKKEIIDLPVIATINVHPSYLPEYRGPNPYLQTILNRETKSGVTFHLMNEEYDAGAVLAQKRVNIIPGDTSKELKERTVFHARLLCAEVLKKLGYGLVIPVNQDESKATYFPNIKREDMMLDFEKETAEEIHARIRAFHPFLPCYYEYKNFYFIPNPYKLEIINKSGDTGKIICKDAKAASITIACKNGRALKMSGVRLYGFKIFTKFFIQHFVK